MSPPRNPRVIAILLVATTAALGQSPNQKQEPKDPNAAAELAYNRGQYPEVLKFTEKQLKEKPNDHIARYLSASALVEIGRQSGSAAGVRQGIEDARKAIELTKGQTSRYYLPYLYGMTSLTELEGNTQHAELAITTADQVITKEKVPANRSHLFYHRARTNSVLEKHTKAQSDFQEAIRLEPTFLSAWMGLADAFLNEDKTERARETYDEATRKFPGNPLVLNNRGLFLQDIEEYELAVADFTAALQLNPRFLAAYTNRGYTLLAMDDPEAAELDFAASLSLAPQQPMVLRLRAGCRLLQKQITLAIEDLTAAMKLRADAAVHIDLGFAKLMNRNFKEAAELLGKAQTMDPKLQHIRPWRLSALIALKQREPALKEYAADLARAKANANDSAWNDWLCAFMADVISEPRLMQVASSDPEKKTGRLTEAHFFLGMKAEIAGDTATASKHYRQSLTRDRKDLATYRGALIALERTNPSAAK